MPGKRADELAAAIGIGNISLAGREVSVGEFREFVRRTGHRTDCEKLGGGWVIVARKHWVRKADACWDNPYLRQEEHDPVVLVSWYDAITFANWKSARDGLTPAYKTTGSDHRWTVELDPAADGYRLPTEDEWEGAARAGIIELSSATVASKRKTDTGRVSGLPPDPWCSGGSHGQRFEWCWDSLGPVRLEMSGNSGAVMMPTRVCRGLGPTKVEQGELLPCGGTCAPLTAASTLGFRLVKGRPAKQKNATGSNNS